MLVCLCLCQALFQCRTEIELRLFDTQRTEASCIVYVLKASDAIYSQRMKKKSFHLSSMKSHMLNMDKAVNNS